MQFPNCPTWGWIHLISYFTSTYCAGREKFLWEIQLRLCWLFLFPTSRKNGRVSNSVPMMEFFLTHSYDKGYIILAILSSLGICCKTYTKVRSKFFAHLFFLPFFGLGFCILFFFSCNIWSAEGLIHPSSLLHACNSHPNTKHRPHESFQHCQRVWYS